MFLTKFSTKKFHLVSKYVNYPTWDEKQNAPEHLKIFKFLIGLQIMRESYCSLKLKGDSMDPVVFIVALVALALVADSVM